MWSFVVNAENSALNFGGFSKDLLTTLCACFTGRPSEVDQLLGDSTKAKKILGWESKISFEDLVSEMVENDLKEIKK